MTAREEENQALQDEIKHLEARLSSAKLRLHQRNGDDLNGTNHNAPALNSSDAITPIDPSSFTPLTPSPSSLHTLLLLADSALPLGSFAFSSGLESYLGHHRSRTTSPTTLFHKFLHLSLISLASTALPYVLAAYREPERLEELDNDFDASTVCNVARRASVAQGRALLSVWERAFRSQYKDQGQGYEDGQAGASDGKDEQQAQSLALASLRAFSTALKTANADNTPYPPSAHFPPLWGTLTLALGLPLHSSAYLFLFSHARTVVSAAVRASVLGPYQAQGVLASRRLQKEIERLVTEHWDWRTEEAGQCVPVVDLWVGRHEILYSRIFNS
jgi:urease accessory protein